MKKKWLKISIVSNSVLVDAIGDFLVGVTGAGIEMGVDDHLSAKKINAFIAEENLSKEKSTFLVEQLSGHLHELADIFKVEMPTFTVDSIEEEDWGNSWKQHFHPFEIVPGLTIAPTWEDYKPKKGTKVITMDPGMAFGTGHHATTRMSLQLLQEVIDAPMRPKVLDVGTGTGILGMASALFGAAKVVGIDNDPEAVGAALENINRNGMEHKMEVTLSPLSSLSEEFDVICANIIHDVLVNMSEDFERLLEKGGQLIISGILQGEQVENIIKCFSNNNFQLQEEKAEKEWAALLFTNNS